MNYNKQPFHDFGANENSLFAQPSLLVQTSSRKSGYAHE